MRREADLNRKAGSQVLTGIKILKFPPGRSVVLTPNWFNVTFTVWFKYYYRIWLSSGDPYIFLSFSSRNVQKPGLWAVLLRGINEYFITMRAETWIEGEWSLDSVWLWCYSGLTNWHNMAEIELFKVLKDSWGNISVVYEMVHRLYG